MVGWRALGCTVRARVPAAVGRRRAVRTPPVGSRPLVARGHVVGRRRVASWPRRQRTSTPSAATVHAASSPMVVVARMRMVGIRRRWTTRWRRPIAVIVRIAAAVICIALWPTVVLSLRCSTSAPLSAAAEALPIVRRRRHMRAEAAATAVLQIHVVLSPHSLYCGLLDAVAVDTLLVL